MFTIQSYTDEINKEARSRIVTVVFSDGVTNPTIPFRFSVDADILTIKKAVKGYLDELNTVAEPITGDLADIPVVTPPPIDVEREEWNKDRARLALLVELVRDGVFTGSETQITSLRTKVRNGFKPEYLN